ncbi:YcdB/YcdC domain-containing protein [uncultured Brevibacillus sp.]|uniref:YcdB/YcdC domain-containing protein n=1 Tax=uncultured Brevibacillus sp. TaxID=169970 RepID=UPI0025916057|nr:YcdB/YcdC domain-containing protein [uncultured Brevibacillus sp.]
MKKWTRSMYVLLAASLVVTAPSSLVAAKESSAQDKRSETGAVDEKTVRKVEQAIAKLSELVPYLKDYPITEYELTEDESLIFVQKYQAKDKEFPNVGLNFDKTTGKIETFRLSTDPGSDSTPLYEGAKEKATAFMKKWFGEDMGGYQYEPDTPKYNDTILFRKIVNGIPFLNDTISITVGSGRQILGKEKGDGYTKSIANEQEGRRIQFADPKQAISREMIEQEFASSMKPYFGLSADGKQYRFLYAPALGEIVASSGKDKGDQAKKAEDRVIQFQPRAKEAFVKSKEEAVAFLASKTGFDFTKGRAGFQEVSDLDKGDTNYVWMSEDGVIGSLFFETKTGKVKNYQVLETKQKSEADKKLTEEQALQKAVEAMSEFLPLTDKEMTLTANRYEADKNLYEFDFNLAYQGYVVDNLLRQAHVDAATGKVTLLDWQVGKTLPFPDITKAISRVEAARKYLQKYPLKLYYSINKANKNVAELVYRLPTSPDEDIDALTGEFYQFGVGK